MKRLGLIEMSAFAIAVITMATCVAAISDEPKPTRQGNPARDSAKSSPPDRTPYVRPAIPEDRPNTAPKPPHANTPPTSREK
jgi:hypothetical protein